jgi:iron(III) transport system ATP-binding protein
MSGLHMRAISHAFGSHKVLSGVSLSVAPGELICLLGPSGCGKTTLLRLAAGLEHLQTGQVEIAGRVVADGSRSGQLPPEQRSVGLMFQDYALFPHLNVHDNVAFGLDLAKGGHRSAWIKDALGAMGLTAYANAYPHTLSGGQQQRVALIRALAPAPQILLLDEPFSGLDVTRRAQIRSETLDLVKQAGVATMMVTHDPEEAMFMADRILVMNAGRIVQDGTPVDLYFQPSDAFVAELFGPVNRFTGTVRQGRVKTPLGHFDVQGLSDDSAVEVMIRPEALRLSLNSDDPAPLPGDNAALVRADSMPVVRTARPLGRSSFLVLHFDHGQSVEARVPGLFLPPVGTRVSVAVNSRQVHIFQAP